MTTWRIDPEPDCDRLWVAPHDMSGAVEYRRVGTTDRYGTPVAVWGSQSGSRDQRTWPGLLALGEVSDTHPDLPRRAPLPWTWDDEDGITDARGNGIDSRDQEVTSFIVRAANALHKRILAGEEAIED